MTNRSVPTVDDVRVIEGRGPWPSKSGGKLDLLVWLPPIEGTFFQYDDAELKKLSSDIRGFRSYTVRDIPKYGIGGTEFHRIRQEMVFPLEGAIQWVCEDLFGNTREFTIAGRTGIWMPPFIMHTYEAMETGSGLIVVANTLFDPDDARTHDTYSLEVFRELQGQHQG